VTAFSAVKGAPLAAVASLRATEEWSFVEREVDIRDENRSRGIGASGLVPRTRQRAAVRC
jgi:hypothetical protein